MGCTRPSGWVAALLLAPLLAVAGCSDDTARVSQVGLRCASAVDCGVRGAVCVMQGKHGSCALPCEVPGAADQCPPGSYCNRQAVDLDGGPPVDRVLCTAACKDASDCQSGYLCEPVGGGPGRVCLPQ